MSRPLDDYDYPVLPYGGATNPNSGHAGSDTSKASAVEQDASGATSEQQHLVMTLVRLNNRQGVTVGEVRRATGYHHGTASRVLSDLHTSGALCRLTETRGHAKVYVLPEYVNGRETEPQGRTATVQLLDDMAELLNRWLTGFSTPDRGCYTHGANPPIAGWCLRCDSKAALDRYDNRRH